MPAPGSYARLRSTGAQFLRFSMVGAANTLVDVAVTNALVLLIRPQSGVTLMLISVAACALATLNSYALNRRWTFRHPTGEVPDRAVAKFFVVALLSMAVNTSTFLFFMKYLPDLLTLNALVTINLSKLAGVAAAFSVSFLGYRFGVFETDAVRRFRTSFRFPRPSAGSPAAQMLVLLLAAAFVRAAYLLVTHAVYGDAASYGWVAGVLSRGDFTQADGFWTNLFSWWEAVLRKAGSGPVPAAVLASFIPGVLLVVPVVALARSLYGSPVAWLAGALCVAHPRFVEYSCNGYPETFYTLAFTSAIAFLTRVVRRGGRVPAAFSGVAFGAFTCVRNEGVLVFGLALILVAAARRRTIPATPAAHTDPLPRTGPGGEILCATAGYAVVIGGYVFLSMVTAGTPGLFQKNPNLAKQFSEQLDMREAARETYGARGLLYGPPRPGSSVGEHVVLLAKRLPRNLLYSLERLPGIMISPVPLFALMLPFFAGRPGVREGPLLLMLVFPLVFNPLVQVEPRLMYPMLVPLQIFGAAGLAAFASYVQAGYDVRRVLALAGGGVVLLTAGLAGWRAWDVERNYDFQEPLAQWMRVNIPADETVVGCGYGYVSTTGFLADHRTVPRIWTEDPRELAAFASGRCARWIIMYERFVRFANAELQPVFDSGIPGFVPVYQVVDHRGFRTCVFRRDVPF